MALAGALALVACGSDNNSSSSSGAAGGGSSSSGADLSGTLNGEGSTAQKNAIDETIAPFSQSHQNAKVSYNATGSGAGIKAFTNAQVDWAGSDSALKTDPGGGRRGEEALRRQRRVEPPARRGPHRRGVQRARCRPARAHAVSGRQDLPR
jgi:phosphate transport system substrate-binding protein